MPYPTLPDQISDLFSLDELRGLCFELGLEFENLRGETREAKALALVEFCELGGDWLISCWRFVRGNGRPTPGTPPNSANAPPTSAKNIWPTCAAATNI
ncbi:MAG: hypothetical protein R3D55_05055 [Chloroflexota bacterium]